MATTENPTGRRRSPDLALGLAVLAFCAVAYWITLSFEEAPAAIAQNVQPAGFPRMVIGVMAVLALVLVAGAWRGESTPQPPPLGKEGEKEEGARGRFRKLRGWIPPVTT